MRMDGLMNSDGIRFMHLSGWISIRKTVEEIAVSIAAQLVKVKNTKR